MPANKNTGINFKNNPPHVILFGAVSSKGQIGDDKDSLPDQFKSLEEVAHKRGWKIIDRISIPGFSRKFRTYEQFCEAAVAANIHDPARMLGHWRNADFDILACINATRFGRTRSIIHQFIDTTYEDAGAYIFTLRNDVIPYENRGLFGMMEGHIASTELEEMNRRKDVGMRHRAMLGFHPGQIPWFHRYTFNERGEHLQSRGADGHDYYLTVNRERWGRLLDDLYEIFVEERVSGIYVERELAKRGHLAASGRPYNSRFFTLEMWKPTFWGITGYELGQARQRWKIDEAYAHEAPPDVTINYHGCEPCFIGEKGALLRLELLTRQELRGKSKPHLRHLFSGLLVCPVCGASFVYQDGGGYGYYYCCTRILSRRNETVRVCPNRRGVRESEIINYFKRQIAVIQAGQFEATLRGLYAGVPVVSPDTLENELAEVNAIIETLTLRTADKNLPPKALSDYYTMIARHTENRERLEAQRTIRHASDVQIRQHIELIRSPDLLSRLNGIWERGESEANQLLHQLLQSVKVQVLDGAPVGLVLR